MGSGAGYRVKGNRYRKLSERLNKEKYSIYQRLSSMEDDTGGAGNYIFYEEYEFIGPLNEAYFLISKEAFFDMRGISYSYEDQIAVLGRKSQEAGEIAENYYWLAEEADSEGDY